MISRRGFAGGLLAGAVGAALDPPSLRAAEKNESVGAGCTLTSAEWQQHLPGIWKARLGTPEQSTPVSLRTIPPLQDGLASMPAVSSPPLSAVQGCSSERGFEITLPLAAGELIYGFGLQMYSVMQRGSKKTLRVNADPKGDAGDAHAPVPFYVTTHGYGVLIDTARYASFYSGSTHLHKDRKAQEAPPAYAEAPPLARFAEPATMRIEIPHAKGVDIYLFAGPAMLQAVERYNLFAGGGVNPPEWGLGFWYRAYLNSNSDQLLAQAQEFRDRKIPCDVLGLEPGWQTHAYACSFIWDPKKFPKPATTVNSLKKMDYQLNLWEHAYTHSTAPNYRQLEPVSGDYETFDGLVPDFNLPQARRIFGDHQSHAFLDIGISGFKLDECDSSDFTGGWAFPEFSRFPSGVDGEQMHSVFGLRYQDAILEAFNRAGRPTYGLVRSSGALAAPYPFVLYSDLYDHRVFIRALINSGFTGLLFCPEVRDAESAEDLIRRMQSVVFCPLAMINGWYVQNPPWKQIHASWDTFHEREKNPGKFDEGWEKVEAQCRDILGWRMQLVPYLRAAFAEYASNGTPPFRAPILDWPDDASLALLEDEYMVGDRMLVAPVFAKQTSRDIVLPRGAWCDYWTGEAVEGGRKFTVQTTLDRIPVYLKSGSILPVAEIGPSSNSPESRRLTVRVYGDGSIPFSLHEKGKAPMEISWNNATGKGSFQSGSPTGRPYTIAGWKKMSS